MTEAAQFSCRDILLREDGQLLVPALSVREGKGTIADLRQSVKNLLVLKVVFRFTGSCGTFDLSHRFALN